jgi:hypothetical protein
MSRPHGLTVISFSKPERVRWDDPSLAPIRAASEAIGKHTSDLNRADIAKRDWTKVQIDGDRREPIWLPDGHRRTWR